MLINRFLWVWLAPGILFLLAILLFPWLTMSAFLSFEDFGIRPPCLNVWNGNIYMCASRDALVHCANALPFTLARWVISSYGSGGKDEAPSSWAVIVFANDGHLQFKNAHSFCRIVFWTSAISERWRC